MKKFQVAFLAIIFALLILGEADAKTIPYTLISKKTGRETLINVKRPIYLVHGILSSNQTWGNGMTKCMIQTLREAGYKLDKNMFLVGASQVGDAAQVQMMLQQIATAFGKGIIPFLAGIGIGPLSPLSPALVSLDYLSPQDKVNLLYQAMGLPNRGLDPNLRNSFPISKDTKRIMNSVPPELAAEGIDMTYRDLQKLNDQMGIEAIAHSNGGRAIVTFAQQTGDNGYAPTREIQQFDPAKGRNVSQQFPSPEDIKNGNKVSPPYDDSFRALISLGTPYAGTPLADVVESDGITGKIANGLSDIPSQPQIGDLMENSSANKDMLSKNLPKKIKVINIIEGRSKLPPLLVKGSIPGDGATPESVKNVVFGDGTGNQVQTILVSTFSNQIIKHTDMTSSAKIKDELKDLLDMDALRRALAKMLVSPDDNEDLSSATLLPLPEEKFTPRLVELAKAKGKGNLLNYVEYKKLLVQQEDLLVAGAGPQAEPLSLRIQELYPTLENMDDQIWREYQETPDVAVLTGGADRSALPLIDSCEEPVTSVPMAFDPLIYEHKKILIIPSGALQGYDGSKFFKARLDEFVKNGGVIICFTQPYGYNYDALPPMKGNELAGYGFQQDQNCYYKGSYLDQLHPIIKGQQDGQIDVYTDGYFTAWPQQAITPIRRAKNDAPCVVIYPYGKGWVCATTLYMDWGYTHQQFSDDEKQLIQDLIAWGKDPNKPLMDEERAKLKFEPRQNEEAQMFITSDQEEYAYGAPALFSVHVTNKTDKAQQYRLYWAFPGSAVAGKWPNFGKVVRRDPLPPITTNFVDIKVGPHEQVEHFVAAPVVVSPETMWAYLYAEGDQYLATASRTFGLVKTAMGVNVVVPEDLSKLKGTMPILVNCKNWTTSGFGNIAVKLTMVDPKSQIAFEETKEIELGAVETKTAVFEIPKTGKKGFYTLAAEVKAGEEKVGLGTGYIQIAEPIFDISPAIKETTDQKVEAQFSVRNLGAVTDTKGTLRIKLLDPLGKVLKELDQILDTDSQTEFQIPFLAEGTGPLAVGDYRLTHELTWEDKKVEGTTVLPNQFLVAAQFDKASYDAEQPWKLSISVENVGRFTLNTSLLVKIPAFHYEKTIEIVPAFAGIPANAEASPPSAPRNDIVLEGIVPDDAAVGVGSAAIKLQMAGASAATATFKVRESDLQWELAASDYKAGSALHFTLRNQGGVPTNAQSTVSFEDITGNILAQQSQNTMIAQGKFDAIDLAIPSGIKSGPYVIDAKAKDGVTQRTTVLKKPVTAQGLAASIDTKLSQESLGAGENLQIEALLKSLGLGSTFEGVLKARVMRNGPSPPDRWEAFDTLSRVTGLAIDGDDIWMGLSSIGSPSSGYLIRYNVVKKRWKTYPLLPENASADATYIHAIVPTENDVWFVSFRAGVSRYDKKRAQWETYLQGDKLSSNEILQMQLDGDEVWFRSRTAIDKLNLKSNDVRHYSLSDGLPSADLTALSVQAGEAWVGSKMGVYRYDKTKDHWDVALQGESGREYPLAIAIGEKDVWVGIYQYGFENGRYRGRVGRYDRANRTWSFFYSAYQENGQPMPANSPLMSTPIDHIAVDGDWVWFAGTTFSGEIQPNGQAGICRYNTRENRWETFSEISSTSLWSIQNWKIGTRYVALAGAGSLSIFDKELGSWKIYLNEKGFGGPFYQLGLDEPAKKLWVYYQGSDTRDHLSKLDLTDDLWERIDPWINGTPKGLVLDSGGDLWVSTFGSNDLRDQFGVTHYDWKQDEWEKIVAGSDAMLDNRFWSLGADGKNVWIGHSNGISRYDVQSGKWQRYYGANRSDPNPNLSFNVYFPTDIRSDDNAVWFFQGGSGPLLYRYNKIKDNWMTFDVPLSEAQFMALGDTAMWVGSIYQNYAAKLDLKTEQFELSYPEPREDPDWNAYKADHLIATPQDIWFLLKILRADGSYAIQRYGADGKWKRYLAKDVGASDISYRNVLQRGEEFLFAGTGGLIRLNDRTGAWSVVHAKEGELLSDNIFTIGLRNTEVWLGTAAGINIWEPENNAWRTFPADKKQFNFTASQFAFGPDSNAVWALRSDGHSNYGVGRLLPAQDNSKPLWAKEFQVTVSDITSLSQTIEGLFSAGEYELVLDLYSKDGQLLVTQSKPFSVRRGGQIVTIAMDRPTYIVGQTAQIEMRVTNTGKEEALGVPIGLFYGDEKIISERQDFAGSETKSFSAAISAAKGKILRAVAGDTVITRTLDVRQPQLSAMLKAPEIAGQDAFTAEVVLENTGDIDLSLNVDLTDVKNFGAVMLSAGQKLSLFATTKITSDVELGVVVTGDMFQTARYKVVYGTKVSAKAEIPAKILEGTFALPWTVENTGLTSANTFVRLRLLDIANKTVLDTTRDVHLEKGEKFSDSAAVKLAAGEYQLKLMWEGGEQDYALSVHAQPPLTLTVQDKGFASGNRAFGAIVANAREESAKGVLRTSFAGVTRESEFSAAAKSSVQIDVVFPLAGMAEGEYPVSFDVLEAGHVVASWSGKLQVPKGEIKLLIPQDPLSFSVGSQGKVGFQIVNDTSSQISESLTFALEGLAQDTRNVLVGPYQTVSQEFAWAIPDDFPQGVYQAQYEFHGIKAKLPIVIVGPQVNVSWTLDKPSYAKGDTAHLAITVQNLGQPWNLEAVLRYKAFQKSENFFLEGQKTLVFDVPLNELDGEKIFFAVNTKEGRSLYINRFDVRATGAAVEVTLDKQDYDPADVVTIHVIPKVPGKIKLSSLGGFAVEESINGEKTYTFKLPAQLPQQTYAVDYEFENSPARVLFNVRGDSVKIVSGTLKRQEAQTSCQAEWKVLSNRAMTARLTVSLMGGDVSAEVLQIDKEISLTQGENMLTEEISCAGISVGIARVRAAIYISGREGPAAVCESALDEGPAAILSVTTDKTVYAPGEAVQLIVTSFGESPTPMKLMTGSAQTLWEGTVEYHSVTQTTLDVGALDLGEHTLTIQLGDGSAGSVSTVPVRVVVQAPPVPVIPVEPPSDVAPSPTPPPSVPSIPVPATPVAPAPTTSQGITPATGSSGTGSVPLATNPSPTIGGTIAILSGQGFGSKVPVSKQEITDESPAASIEPLGSIAQISEIRPADRAKLHSKPQHAMKRKKSIVLRRPPRIGPTRQSWFALNAMPVLTMQNQTNDHAGASPNRWRIAQLIFLGVLALGAGTLYRRARIARQRSRTSSSSHALRASKEDRKILR